MCSVSAVGDQYRGKWEPLDKMGWPSPFIPAGPTRAEFDALKAEVEQMRKELLAAKAEDERNNAPDCHMEEKVAILKKVAKMAGVSLDDIFVAK